MSRSSNTVIFQVSIFILVFMNELQKVYLFTQIVFLNSLFNYLELILYAALLVCILNKKWRTKEMIAIAFITGLLGAGLLTTGNAIFFRGFLVIVAAKGVSFRKILKTCRYAITIVAASSIVLFFLGLSNDATYEKAGMALGFTHPNQAALIIMIITLMWVTERQFKLKIKQIVIIYLLNFTVLLITGSKSVFVILFITPLFVFLNKNSIRKEGLIYKTTILVQPLMVLFTVVSGLNYSGSNIIRFLDTKYFSLLNTFTGRIYLNWRAFNTYGFSLFGKTVDLSNDLTVDNAYAVSLITMGVIPTILFSLGYCYIVFKAIKAKNYIVISVAAVLSIYGIMEAAMLEVYNNFIYLSMLAIPMVMVEKGQNMWCRTNLVKKRRKRIRIHGLSNS